MNKVLWNGAVWRYDLIALNGDNLEFRLYVGPLGYHVFVPFGMKISDALCKALEEHFKAEAWREKWEA
jgi:hypothetical protein